MPEAARHVDRMRIHLTLDCQLRCSYCNIRPKDAAGDRSASYTPLTPAEWLGIILREPYPVVLTGGEPTLYPGLVDLINGIPPTRHVWLYTNLIEDPLPLADRVRRPLQVLAGYHPGACGVDVFFRHLDRLVARADFLGQVCMVSVPEHIEAIPGFLSRSRRLPPSRWTYKLDADHWSLIEQRRKLEAVGLAGHRPARCTVRNIILAPDGVRYPCGAMMRRRTMPQEHALHKPLRGNTVTVRCDLPDACLPCDLLSRSAPSGLQERS